MFCSFCGNEMEVIQPKTRTEMQDLLEGESFITRYRCNKCKQDFCEDEETGIMAADVPASERSWSLSFAKNEIIDKEE